MKCIYTIFIKTIFIIKFAFNNLRKNTPIHQGGDDLIEFRRWIRAIINHTLFMIKNIIINTSTINTWLQIHLMKKWILGIVKLIFTENEIEKWSKLPRGLTTPVALRCRSRQLPRLCVGFLISWVHQTNFQNQMLQFHDNQWNS